MKNIFAIILIGLTLASCGRLHKTVATDQSTVKNSGSTDITESITTKETVDTLVLLKPDSAESVIELVPNPDTTYLVIDDERQKVEVAYDPITRKLRTKAVVKEQLVPVKIERETHTERKISADYKSVEKSKHSEEEVTKTNPLIPWWFWFIILLGIGGYLIFRYVVRMPP